MAVRRHAARQAARLPVNWRRVLALALNTMFWAGLIWVAARFLARHP